MLFFSKNRKETVYLSLTALLLVFSLISCETEEPECYEPTVVNVNSWFQVRDSVTTLLPDSTEVRVLQSKDTTFKAPIFQALDLDSISYRVIGSSTATIGVALNPATEKMRYRIQTDTLSDLSDTITFFYQPSLHFISNNCGYTNYFTLDSIHITRNIFDSAILSDPNVTSSVTTKHVFLYLHQ